jgi:hypothetical protein
VSGVPPLFRAALDAFQHQDHLQRDRHLRRVGASSGFLELAFDVLPVDFARAPCSSGLTAEAREIIAKIKIRPAVI